MTSSTLDLVPAGHRVFVDSTIFIYHFTGASLACRVFLERCEREEVNAFTSVRASVSAMDSSPANVKREAAGGHRDVRFR
jgi:hypothetical protein